MRSVATGRDPDWLSAFFAKIVAPALRTLDAVRHQQRPNPRCLHRRREKPALSWNASLE
jgi:hypothetical protein